MGYIFHAQYKEVVASAWQTNEPYQIELIAEDFTLVDGIPLATLLGMRPTYPTYAGKTLEGGVGSYFPGTLRPMITYPVQTWAGPGDGSTCQVWGYFVHLQDFPNWVVLMHKYDAPILLASAAVSHSIKPQWIVRTLPN